MFCLCSCLTCSRLKGKIFKEFKSYEAGALHDFLLYQIQLELKFSRSISAFGFCLEGGSEFELGLHLCRLRRVGAPSQANAAIITRRRPGSRRLLWCAAETQDISITRVEQQLCLIATYRSFRETTRGFQLQSSEHFPDKALDLRSRIKSH